MQDLIQPYLSSIGELRTIRDLKEYDTHFNIILSDFRKLTIPKSALTALHTTPALSPLPLGEGQGEGSPAPTTTNDDAEEQPAANSQPPTAPTKGKRK